MSLSNILNKTHAEVVPYNLVVNSISTADLQFSSGLILASLAAAGQSVALGGLVDVIFNNIDDADDFTSYNPSTGVFTVQKSSHYSLVFSGVFDSAGSAGTMSAYLEFIDPGPITRNLSFVSGPIVVGLPANGMCISCNRYLFAGTTFKVRVFQNAVNPLLLLGNSQAFPSLFTVTRLSYESSD